MTDYNASDREVSRAIRSWLHVDRHEDVSRIAGAVLTQAETTPQRRTPWWPARRIPTMNKFATVALGAAAVVVALFIGVQLFNTPDGGTGSEPSSSPEASVAEPTTEPSSEPTSDGLPEGPFLILDGQTDDPADSIPPLTVTIPAPGWDGEEGGGILIKDEIVGPSDDAGMIIFVKQEYIVYGDACHWESTVPETPATTVDELVAALSSQESRTASEPVDIELGGYAGKSITLEVPDDVDFADCDAGYGGSWDCGGDGMSPCGYHSGAGEVDTVYVLDVDGRLMAWQTGHQTETSAEVVSELEAIVQSASFGE
jgi:hypothetical protein